MNKRIVEIFGWHGTIAILGAYGLISFSLIKSTDLTYQVLNLTGALGIITDAFYKKDYQPGVLNVLGWR